MDDKTVEQIAELAKKIIIKNQFTFEMNLKALSEGRSAKLSSDYWIEWYITRFNEMIMYAVGNVEQMAALAQIELPTSCDKMKSERYFIQQEGIPMSDLIRQEVSSNLSLRLSSLINLFPNNNYHYEELQCEINRTILQHNTTEMSRREAIKGIVFTPLQFCLLDEVITLSHAHNDNDTLLKHIAAALSGAWYIKHHRGKEHVFIDGLVSEYIKILQQVACSKQEAHRMAAFSLLAQSLLLRAGIIRLCKNDSVYALKLAEQGICYAIESHNMRLEAYGNCSIAGTLWIQGKYKEAVERATKAEALMSNLDTISQSWILSELSYCQAYVGKPDEANASIKAARDLFDPRLPFPTGMQFSETTLLDHAGITASRNGNYGEAASLFEEEAKVTQTPLGEVQAWLGRAKVEATRDDATCNVGMVLHLVGKSADKAREMGSQLFVNRAHDIFKIQAGTPSSSKYHDSDMKKFEEEHFPSMN